MITSPTNEALEAIAAAIRLHAPDLAFLTLIAPNSGKLQISVVSNLMNEHQAELAQFFIDGYEMIKNGTIKVTMPPKAN